MYSADLRAWVEAANGPSERALRQAIHTTVAAIAGNRHLHEGQGSGILK